MSDESPIVSHVATQAYREHVDEMTCKEPGCKRWRIDEWRDRCQEHSPKAICIPQPGDFVRGDGKP